MRILLLTTLVLGSAGALGEPPDREKIHAAMETCFTEKGLVKPQPGQRPSEADRQAMDECLASKGFQRPPGPPSGHRRDQAARPSNLPSESAR